MLKTKGKWNPYANLGHSKLAGYSFRTVLYRFRVVTGIKQDRLSLKNNPPDRYYSLDSKAYLEIP
jgi:hypothetical protein